MLNTICKAKTEVNAAYAYVSKGSHLQFML